MSGENCGEINRAGTLRSVEAPDRLRGLRIHIHGFGTVAPTGGDGQGNSDVFAAELVRTCCGFRNTADCGVRNDTFNRSAVRMTKCGADEFSRRTRHLHGLLFKRLANPFSSAVNCGTNPDFRVLGDLDHRSDRPRSLDCLLLSFHCHNRTPFLIRFASENIFIHQIQYRLVYKLQVEQLRFFIKQSISRMIFPANHQLCR